MRRISLGTMLNFILLIVMVFFLSAKDVIISSSDKEASVFITIVSFTLLLFEIWELRNKGIELFSLLSIFTVLCHVFFLGNFYIKAFGMEEYYLYSDWLSTDAGIKINAGLFSLVCIQAIFCGIILSLDKKNRKSVTDYSFAQCLSKDDRLNSILIAGRVLLAIGLPFQLVLDISRIRYSLIANVYAGFEGSVGLADDLYVFFVPALICLMYGYGLKKRKKLCTSILVLYVVWTFIVMAASGARREYATGIIAISLCYYQLFLNKQTRGINKIVRNIIIAIFGIVVLNFLTMVREYRHIQLGIQYILSEHFFDLFSLKFIWETIAEFSLTGSPIYFSLKYFPETVPFQYGFTYLASFIYILPIGWLVDINSSVGSILYDITGWAAGGSMVADLYANWGWFSPLFAILVGLIIGRICDTRNNDPQFASFSSVIAYSVGYILLTYPRASTSEVMRHGAYVFIFMYLLLKFFSLRRVKQNQRKP